MGEIDLPPVADAYVSQINPTTPFGLTDPDFLHTQGSRGVSGPCSTTKPVLLKFDVALIANDVTTASLKLQNTYYTGPSSNIVLGIWPAGDNWDELTVTWNTRPISYGPPLSTRSSPMPPTGDILLFPSTAALVNYVNSQLLINGGDGVVTLMTGYVTCPPLQAPQVRNNSKENLNPVAPPLLRLGPVPIPRAPWQPSSGARASGLGLLAPDRARPVLGSVTAAGCPQDVQICNVAWIYTSQTNTWQPSNPAFNPAHHVYLPLSLKTP
jgi:hypothetical protein